MELRLHKRLANMTSLTIILEGEKSLKEGILKLTPFLNFPTACGICESSNLTLVSTANKAKQGNHAGEVFVYAMVKCIDCGSTLPFGEYKNYDAYYLKNEWQSPRGNQK